MSRVGLGCLLMLTGAWLSPSASAGQFHHVTYYGTGPHTLPYYVIAAQFTNSGNLDLAIADYLNSEVSVLLGNGDGTFQKPLKFSASEPISLAAGDFNEDGHLDLVVGEYGGTGTGAVGIYLGDGAGKFRLSATYQLGIDSGLVTAADFNGDGHVDVAASSAGTNGKGGNVMVFFGTGRGTLKKPTIYRVSGSPSTITAGDLNGDHHPDLAVTQFSTGSVAVLLNDGTGKFGMPVSYDAGGGEAVDVKIADLRNNGSEDLVVANISQGMVVLLNKGDGTFGKATIYRMCAGCLAADAVAIADFNLDGNPDIAVASQSGDSALFYGNGEGQFGAANPIKDPIGSDGGYSIAAGDFNNDKAPDLAIPIELNGKVAILLNTH